MNSQIENRVRNTVEPAHWSPGEFAAHGPVHLNVTDGERSLLFWRDVLGLEVTGGDGEAIELGAGDRTMLVLHPGANTPAQRGRAGLYHVAVHVPDASEFAYVLSRFYAARYPHSPTEHVFSKATYLDDLDGNGVEITLETPDRVKEVKLTSGRPELITADGKSHPPVGHLDLEEAMSHLKEDEGDRPLKAGTWIGHVHLHVTDLDQARTFYSELLGFPIGLDTPEIGMLDVHFDGKFKHRLAFNVWNGPTAEQAPAGTAGLRHATLVFSGREKLDATLERLAEAGYAVTDSEYGMLVRDPAGNGLILDAR